MRGNVDEMGLQNASCLQCLTDFFAFSSTDEAFKKRTMSASTDWYTKRTNERTKEHYAIKFDFG